MPPRPSAAGWQPTKPLKLVVPFAPGGQPDVVARTLAGPLAKALGQPVVVENRPGAGGNIAADFVAKSAPDGHTLLMGTNGPLALSVVIYRSVPFDPLRDFAPVTLVGTAPNLIAVQPSLGVSTVRELAARARAEPGRLNYASVGKGSVSQLSMEMLNAMAGIRIEHIPYNGGAPAVMALVAGDVQVLSLNPTAILPQVKAGKLKVIAQTGATRSVAPAGRAHGCGIRLPRLRGGRVDGRGRPRNDAARGDRAAERRARAHHPRPRAQGLAVGQAGDRCGRLPARGCHAHDARGDRQVARRGRKGQPGSGLKAPADAPPEAPVPPTRKAALVEVLRALVTGRLVGLTIGWGVRLIAVFILGFGAIFLSVGWLLGVKPIVDAWEFRSFTSRAEGRIVESWVALELDPSRIGPAGFWRATAKASPCAVVEYAGDWGEPLRRGVLRQPPAIQRVVPLARPRAHGARHSLRVAARCRRIRRAGDPPRARCPPVALPAPGPPPGCGPAHRRPRCSRSSGSKPTSP